MNNSTDSETNNLDDVNKMSNDLIKKKRGRPRKNLFLDKPSKNHDRREISNDEKDIILHLPIFLDKKCESERNHFTQNDSEYNDEETILSISDNETDGSSNKNNYKDLIDENKKKDDIIKKLQEELKNKKSYNDIEINKDINIYPISLNLIDNTTNKMIDIKKNNIACWWDSYEFDTLPYFIPDKYYNNNYYVFGCFCSINCAMAYNLNMGDYKISERNALINQLYENIIKLYKKNIVIAPPKEILKKYGGKITLDEYRDNLISCDKIYRMEIPPLISITTVIEEIYNEKIETESTIKPSINNFKKKLSSVRNNLFNTMNMKTIQ